MPIYEYSCSKCGKTIEVIQKFSDPVLKKHKGCGGSLTKLISASGFQFKGSGWYVTDYARKGKNGGDSEAPKESTEKKESTAKTETPAKEPSKKAGGKSGKSGD
ncbi:MAG TPA: zinc ribbon domain-containing protein [Terriglobia bacterium]|nr:zinc ribbon domain-containing protein [Terriglobia bacterium]